MAMFHSATKDVEKLAYKDQAYIGTLEFGFTSEHICIAGKTFSRGYLSRLIPKYEGPGTFFILWFFFLCTEGVVKFYDPRDLSGCRNVVPRPRAILVYIALLPEIIFAVKKRSRFDHSDKYQDMSSLGSQVLMATSLRRLDQYFAKIQAIANADSMVEDLFGHYINRRYIAFLWIACMDTWNLNTNADHFSCKIIKGCWTSSSPPPPPSSSSWLSRLELNLV